MGAVINPEHYATIKPSKGEINLTPLIYATLIIAPHLESVRADTSRIIKNVDVARGDTLRQLGNADSATADTQKFIVRSEKVNGDTCRIVANSEKISADTMRVLAIPAGTYFTPFIWATIKFAKHLISSRVDTLRRLAVENLSRTDTLRQLGRLDSAVADTLKIKGIEFSTSADTLIKIIGTQFTYADTLIKTAVLQNARADTLRDIIYIDSAHADTLRRVVHRARADTLRSITNIARARADTVKRRPLILKYVVENPPVTFKSAKKLNAPLPQQSIVNSFKDFGITSLSATLNERTLSDKLSLETASDIDFEINQLILFQLLDYEYKILIEEINQQDGLRTINGMYDVDQLLYSQVFYSGITLGDNEKVFVTAGGYIAQIAEYFELTPHIKIQDFTPYHDFTGSNITYSDLLNTVFSWTSQLPQRQINVFIRGENLYCIQRGFEESTFDISDLPHSRPIINKKLIRSVWNNPNYKDEEDDEGTPFSGVVSYSTFESNVSIHYDNGLVVSENSRHQTGNRHTSNGIQSVATSNKKYAYTSFDDESYLSQQSITNTAENYEDGEKTTESITTDYYYKGMYSDSSAKDDESNKSEIYLYLETETINRSEYTQNKNTFDGWELTESSTSVRKTMHIPIGNGFYAQNVFIDGVFQGSNLSQGKPGNSVSQYTVQQFNRRHRGSKSNDYESQRSALAPIVNTSFPVRELDLLSDLTNALNWLNRKIQETVTVDLISRFENGVPSINHVVDFTERVILDGNEYFLVSNQITFTPRKFIQKLQLIRWYAQ